MSTPGRPRRITAEAIADAGVKLTLPNVTVRGIAAELGVSEMSIYRHTGDAEGLRNLVAEAIIDRANFTLADLDDPEDALVDLAVRLREFVLEHPGIADYLANLGPRTQLAVDRINRAQTQFAERYAFPAEQASILVSTVAEHAIALAALDFWSHRERRSPDHLSTSLATVRAGALAAAELSPQARFEWSMRAAARGTMQLLGLPSRASAPGSTT
ncbi:TetR/AcrR family transcriptional regulator [Gulosibacter faecalis]|uniref:TetR/AcrR family transcriptional regulator n=1 Tax=Gulosibacter faecalis TaxID=272240 RepID=A0ABW5UVN3_9MICO|nr:TetR/AcrR family transcriptional regulator [Gulosibacter faecalis]